MIFLIKRNFNYVNKDIFLQLYKALVRPHLEYGQIIWYPHLIRQSQLIENVQRRATKIVQGIDHLSYTDRLKYLKLPSLKYRRLRGDLINVFKLLSKENYDCSHLLPLHDRSHYYTRGHETKLLKKRFKCNMRKFSFSVRVTNIWNSLKPDTTNVKNSINVFKKLIDKELISLHYEID